MGKNPSKQRCSSYGPESVSSVGDTSVDLEEFSFLWNVNNFSILSGLSEIRSPVFRGGGPNQNYGWQLVIYPRRKLDVIEFYTFYLSLVDYGDFEGNPGSSESKFSSLHSRRWWRTSCKKRRDDKPTAEFIL
ncbi:TD and POZ domain-containing protein 2 [Orchesella cincta]|uniref:TD and POZ domain-containing protein 2 n=1 Tax=Orchesella cincta TaxID=48709 RepID=A0A1D2M2E6_ORCCI|nr:TD and POZ domain-containing protein 2 [Orchesella cincta]